MGRDYPLKTSFNAGEVSPKLYGRPDLEKFADAAALIQNFLVLPEGGITRRPGTKFVAQTKTQKDHLLLENEDYLLTEDGDRILIDEDADKRVRLIPFEFSDTQSYVLEFGDGYIRFYMNSGQLYATSPFGSLALEQGGLLLTEDEDEILTEQVDNDAAPYEIASPYTQEALWRLQFAQSADVMWITHPDYKPRKLSRTAHTSWTLTEWTPDNGPFMAPNDTAVKIYASNTTGTVTLTADADTFQAGHANSLWRLDEDDRDGYSAWEPSKSYASGAKVRYLENVYEKVNAGTDTSGAVAPVHLSGDAFDGQSSSACLWRYLHSGWGTVFITDVDSPTLAQGVVQRTLPDDCLTPGVTNWREAAWSGYRGWPACVAFFQQRLWTAATYAEPHTLWSTVQGDFDDMQPGALTDDAITLSINSRDANPIRSIAPGRRLHLLTAKREYVVQGSTAPGASLAPDNHAAYAPTDEGAAFALPVVIDGAVVFVKRSGGKLIEIGYDFSSDDFDTIDRTVLAEHVGRPAEAS